MQPPPRQRNLSGARQSGPKAPGRTQKYVHRRDTQGIQNKNHKYLRPLRSLRLCGSLSPPPLRSDLGHARPAEVDPYDAEVLRLEHRVAVAVRTQVVGRGAARGAERRLEQGEIHSVHNVVVVEV